MGLKPLKRIGSGQNTLKSQGRGSTKQVTDENITQHCGSYKNHYVVKWQHNLSATFILALNSQKELLVLEEMNETMNDPMLGKTAWQFP